METMTVVSFAGYAANPVPRLVAPTLDLLQGTGVPAIGAGWRLRTRRTTSAEPDSLPGALLV